MFPQGQKCGRWAPGVWTAWRLQLVRGGQAEELGEKRGELKLLTEVPRRRTVPASPSRRRELGPEMIPGAPQQVGPIKPYNFSAHGILPDRATGTPCPGPHPVPADPPGDAVHHNPDGKLP